MNNFNLVSGDKRSGRIVQCSQRFIESTLIDSYPKQDPAELSIYNEGLTDWLSAFPTPVDRRDAIATFLLTSCHIGVTVEKILSLVNVYLAFKDECWSSNRIYN
ncbi:hypothetical protein PoB_002145900 [Plakobranchus ocellatus]|uniref:Uncharacterized protein n=1 Tax=Plakobranchus ocellatus TaxID=259542 RepID=A0AAV3ZKQ9_9GAST|nr:hypothetical protein PoB_002145900 [Plakobranchus ocellatus]